MEENVITFQMDTAICTRPVHPFKTRPNNLTYTDILKFDYVGAPWRLPPQYQPPPEVS
jgi:hypothetical protein